MPNTKAWASERRCVVVKPPNGGPAVSRSLAAAGMKVTVATSEAEAIAALEREPPAVVLVAQALGPVAIASVAARAGHLQPEVPVVVLGAAGTVQEAVDAMQQGAADYLAPPFDAEPLLVRIRRVLERGHAAEPQPPAGTSPFAGLVGSSPAIRRVIATIDKISRYKTSVLILGESGTGKELIARALHSRGPRRQQLFVPINCATLGRDLLENELFGHERGAFTGADERKKGLFELADGGTLFLDEIGEMDPSTQAKLLRVLERNEFRRVGGTTKVQVDLSVLAATNRNVEEAIRAGKFREDLYYRLKVVTLTVPPLRERKEDIPALIETFIADFNRRHGGKIRGISPQAVALLMAHDWPGNVRELKNAVESAAILAAAETIGADGFADLVRRLDRRPAPGAEEGARLGAGGAVSVPADATLAQAERLLIAAALRRHRSKRAAARSLGIGLRTLYTKLREYRLAPRSPGRAESAQ